MSRGLFSIGRKNAQRLIQPPEEFTMPLTELARYFNQRLRDYPERFLPEDPIVEERGRALSVTGVETLRQSITAYNLGADGLQGWYFGGVEASSLRTATDCS
jgi:hypothetical protein